MPLQVNITTTVNSSKIRRVQHNGREHIVLPSYTLPSNVVMNGILYTAEQIDKHYNKLEGTLAPLGHPQLDGQFVSAFSAEGLNQGYVGAWNRNVKKSGNRIYLEKWVDIEVAGRTDGGRELIERVEAIERGEDVPPIHTSVAAFIEEMEANDMQREQGANSVAVIHDFDHDAILLHETGAATPEQGVGLMVNADQAKPLKANAGALVGETFRDKEHRLEMAARDQLRGDSEYIYVADFTESQAVVVNDTEAKVYGYTIENGSVKFSTDSVKVERRESWAAVVANKVRQFIKPQARPAINQVEGEMPLTPEEKAELAKDFGQVVADAMKPLSDAVTQLQANHNALQETLQAQTKADEAVKRADVAKVYGDIVANGLSGEALDEMHGKLGKKVDLAPNHAGGAGDDEAEFDIDKHFGGV